MDGSPQSSLYFAAIGLLEIFGAENLADFGGPFPSGPVLQVKLHELLCAFNGFLFGLQIENSETADDFFGFGERPVNRGDFIAGDAHGGAADYWGKAAIGDHCAGFDSRFALFVDCVDQCLGRRARKFACGFDQHHESHAVTSFWCSVESLVILSQRPAKVYFHYYDEWLRSESTRPAKGSPIIPSNVVLPARLTGINFPITPAGSNGRCNTF